MKPRRKGNIKSRNQKTNQTRKEEKNCKQHGKIEDRCLSLLKLGLSLKSNKVVNNEDRWFMIHLLQTIQPNWAAEKTLVLGLFVKQFKIWKLSTTVYISATVQLLMCSIMLYSHWRHALRRYGDWVFRQPSFNLKCEILGCSQQYPKGFFLSLSCLELWARVVVIHGVDDTSCKFTLSLEMRQAFNAVDLHLVPD